MKKHLITIAKTFPEKHIKYPQETGFDRAILDGIKKHTIRGNYELWSKKINDIKSGTACLVLKQWIGLPYRTKQIEILRLYNHNGIDVAKINLDPKTGEFKINGEKPSGVTFEDIAKNDFLSPPDLQEWFSGVKMEDDMALIYFSNFRYKL